MKILALDPATSTGFAWHDGSRTGFGTWDLNGLAKRRLNASRLTVLRDSIVEVQQRIGLDLITFEAASFGAFKQPQTAAFHDRLRGVIELTADTLQVRHAAVNISTIKAFATGNGRSKKPQMIRACETFLGIKLGDDQDDVADALLLLEFTKQHALKLMAGESVTMTERPKKQRRQRVKGPQQKLW